MQPLYKVDSFLYIVTGVGGLIVYGGDDTSARGSRWRRFSREYSSIEICHTASRLSRQRLEGTYMLHLLEPSKLLWIYAMNEHHKHGENA
jgi:hypothetical protein